MADTYNPTWNAYKSNVGYQEKISHFLGKYLVSDSSPKPATSFKSMLSVGYGEGDLDVPLLSKYLTGVTMYYGVDPRPSTVETVRAALNGIKDRTIQTDFTTEYVQKYEGPPGPVDFILVGHVMYYVVEEFVSVIEKLLTWLSPGGCLVLSHTNPVNFIFRGESITGGRGIRYSKFSEEKENYKKHVMKAGWTVEDHLVAHQMDFSCPTAEVDLMVGLIFGTEFSAEERNQLNKAIEEESTPGSKAVPYNYEISVIYKKGNP